MVVVVDDDVVRGRMVDVVHEGISTIDDSVVLLLLGTTTDS